MYTYIIMNFAEKLKTLRKEFNLTQLELAQKIGINSNRHISLLESGIHQPSIESIKKLATVFNVSVDYLVFEDVPRSASTHVSEPELFDLIQKLLDSHNQEAISSVKYMIKSAVFKSKVEDATRAS